MTQKLSKKGRNPGAVDSWLETLSYYRKNVAYDETCLFRAVSEQLFNIQNYHEKIRTECIDYARRNTCEFSSLFETEEQLLDHIDRLEKHMVICGNIEIHLISKKYECDVTIFNAAKQQIQHLINEDQKKKILLCLMNDDHYDTVYPFEYIAAAGFAQSIAYKCLYEYVFQIPNVEEIVNGMLYEKTYVTTQSETLIDVKEEPKNEDEEVNEIIGKLTTLNIAPFPFKVAKALDPSMYRNIEYDSWTEVRREMRLGEWYYGDNKLILGTRCLFNDELKNETYDCYIQDIIKNENKCVIYITKLAEKKIVNYTDLSPEDNAKPWPLPYRFTKTIHVATPLTILSMDKIKAQKKKREKSKIKSEPANNSVVTDNDHDVNAFLGAPLQMQNVQEELPDLLSEVTPSSPPPETQTKEMLRYQWEPPYPFPNVMTPIMSDSFSWPGTPVSPAVFNFNVRPVMTPVPTTPNVMQYCEVSQPQVYNYPVESYSYPYQTWTQSEVNRHPPMMSEQNQTNSCQKPAQGDEVNPEFSSSFQETMAEHGTVEQPMVCSPVPRVNPPMGIFSPIIPVPPVTPVIYSPPAEMMIPTTPVPMYTSSIEVPYLVPEPFSYPPTPPTWYPLGVNSQGFIFPNPNVQSVVKPN